jgi:hypothetical protein
MVLFAFVAVAERPHPGQMVPHRGAEMTGKPGQWAEMIERLLGLSAEQRVHHHASVAPAIGFPEDRQRMARELLVQG